MRIPTPEQQIVLDQTARVRVVHAVPGSGKTWLVAEIIRRALKTWPTKTCGIAALSFTRVGGEEIRKAVGRDLEHPHFVGTIDSFLFRYVIRPHLRRVFNWFADPRLVAGEWGAEHWKSCGATQSAAIGNGINLFGCVFINENQGKAVIAHKPHPTLPLRPLTGNDLNQARDAKKKIWETCGLLTHSDAALWASKTLEHEKWGAVVRGEVIRRFPFLIVDELQDTGHFLGKSIRLLLQEPSVHGVLVGDPDQAIYEFTGARPDLFKTFEAILDAVPLTLANSHRCPSAVANAAMHLKDSGGLIGPAQNQIGRAFLVRYKDMVLDVRKVVETVRRIRTAATLKVVARGAATVDELAGRRTEGAPSLYCRPLTHIHRGVVGLRKGKNVSALAATRAALELAVFQHEGVNDEELNAAKIAPHDWKAFAIRCLLKINTIATSGTCYEWHTHAGKILDEEINRFAMGTNLTFVQGKLKPQQRKGWQEPSASFMPQPRVGEEPLLRAPVQTVHGVKGETHDVTVFVCPPTPKADHCPSTLWWSANDKDREERRIAYVAMTRTRGDLVVCVSESCYKRLAASRAAFVASFECVSVAEYVVSQGQEAAAGQFVATEGVSK
jgi:DNA helicase-2/ATP-dependent DNA helicase PcrA